MKWTTVALGAAALYVLTRPRRMAAPAENLSAIPFATDYSGADKWALTAPADDTVAPTREDGRSGETNPLASWLERTFGIRVPMIAPLPITTNASAPIAQGTPAAPPGDWENGSLGMPAVPGTWTPSTSEALPASFVNLSDPNLLMVVMPWGDDVIYVPDPVLY